MNKKEFFPTGKEIDSWFMIKKSPVLLSKERSI